MSDETTRMKSLEQIQDEYYQRVPLLEDKILDTPIPELDGMTQREFDAAMIYDEYRAQFPPLVISDSDARKIFGEDFDKP